ILFYSVLGAAASFDGAYVVRLGASNRLIGLQASLPALAAALAYLPAARFLEGRKNKTRWLIGSLATVRLMYGLFILWPIVAMPVAAPLVVATIVVMQLPAVVWATGWSPMLADVVPERARARVLSWRMVLLSAAVGVLTYGFGIWLERASFPANYQWMYGLAIVGGLLSVYMVSRLRLPPEQAVAPEVHAETQNTSLFAGAWQLLKESSNFRHIVINTLVFNSGIWMIGPLYTILFMKDLGASDGWVGLRMALLQVGSLVGYILWRRVTERLGDAKTLLLALPLTATFPLLVAAFPNLNIILILSLWANLVAPGVDLTHNMIFMAELPPRRREMGVALYSMVMNMAAFVMPLIGVRVAERIGLLPTLVVGGVMRLVGVALFYIKPVKEGMTWRVLLDWGKARQR
ncbi:MAG: MFS transporter, partial [Anaerolineales bacterium]